MRVRCGTDGCGVGTELTGGGKDRGETADIVRLPVYVQITSLLRECDQIYTNNITMATVDNSVDSTKTQRVLNKRLKDCLSPRLSLVSLRCPFLLHRFSLQGLLHPGKVFHRHHRFRV
jgi:hypothetical protein